MVIVREDLIGDAMPATPDLFKYEVQATVFRAPSAIKDPLTKRQLDSLARNDNAGFSRVVGRQGKNKLNGIVKDCYIASVRCAFWVSAAKC